MSATRQGTYSQQKGSPLKVPCRVATTANVASLSGLLTIDTVTVSAGDRVLVWQQGTPAENNIYIAAVGAWSVALDMSLADDLILGMQVYIYDGSAYKDKLFHLTDDSPITFVELVLGTSLSKASAAEIVTGTDDAKYTTPKGIKDAEITPIHKGATPPANTDILWYDTSSESILGTVIEISVTQTTHSLSVGNVIRVSGANTFTKAQASSAANAEAVGIVTVVTDADNFKYVTHGYITTGVPTATAGTVYFLDPSTAGALTATEPTTVGLISKPLLIVLESAAKALFINFRGYEIMTPPTSTVGEIWTSISGTYASTSTFTFTGVDRDTYLIKKSLFTCTDSGGSTRRIGYVKSASNSSGTITVTVVTNSNLAAGDKDFKITYNRKLNDYTYLISVPGECIADTSYPQGPWLDKILDDSYLLPVDAGVQTAAAGAGAALTFNVYKNTTALFNSAPDLTTTTGVVEQRPDTNTLSATETISVRIMSSAGATNKAADFQCKLYIVPTNIYLSI